MRVHYPEEVDLEDLRELLRGLCRSSVVGAVIGRTRLRDEVARHLGCSLLMAERLVDTLIARGLIRQVVHPDGWVYWVVS